MEVINQQKDSDLGDEEEGEEKDDEDDEVPFSNTP